MSIHHRIDPLSTPAPTPDAEGLGQALERQASPTVGKSPKCDGLRNGPDLEAADRQLCAVSNTAGERLRLDRAGKAARTAAAMKSPTPIHFPHLRGMPLSRRPDLAGWRTRGLAPPRAGRGRASAPPGVAPLGLPKPRAGDTQPPSTLRHDPVRRKDFHDDASAYDSVGGRPAFLARPPSWAQLLP
jgi:hypothetical protein